MGLYNVHGLGGYKFLGGGVEEKSARYTRKTLKFTPPPSRTSLNTPLKFGFIGY